jgi:hypothetical protein
MLCVALYSAKIAASMLIVILHFAGIRRAPEMIV